MPHARAKRSSSIIGADVTGWIRPAALPARNCPTVRNPGLTGIRFMSAVDGVTFDLESNGPPPSSGRSGDAPLAVYDAAKKGGNEDALIPPAAIWSDLRVWVFFQAIA